MNAPSLKSYLSQTRGHGVSFTFCKDFASSMYTSNNLFLLVITCKLLSFQLISQ